MKPTRKTRQKKRFETATAKLEDPRPFLREKFGAVVAEKQAADRRHDLAILKLLELIIAGQIPQLPGEDYFVTTCRLIVHGLSGVKTSTATRQTLNNALAELKRGDRGATPDRAEMRRWRGKRTIARALLLLTELEKLVGPVELTGWLQRPNPNLGNRAPVALMEAGRWRVLADFLDDMFTGSPT